MYPTFSKTGFACGDPDRKSSCGYQKQTDNHEAERIGSANSKQETAERAQAGQGKKHSENASDGDHAQTLHAEQPENVEPGGAECHAKANFLCCVA
jgi:hypothetical protein